MQEIRKNCRYCNRRCTLQAEILQLGELWKHYNKDSWRNACTPLRNSQHVRSAHGYGYTLTPSSRCVSVSPSDSDHPCRTLGGPSIHQMEILRRPVSVMSWAQTCSPRSLWVRMVISRSGLSRTTVRNESRIGSWAELSSIHVNDSRFLQSARAFNVFLVILGYPGKQARWTAPINFLSILLPRNTPGDINDLYIVQRFDIIGMRVPYRFLLRSGHIAQDQVFWAELPKGDEWETTEIGPNVGYQHCAHLDIVTSSIMESLCYY